MRNKMRKLAAALTIAGATLAIILPAGVAEARECLGVRGVVCVPDKQCVTDPCSID